jgi:hypothetical protein
MIAACPLNHIGDQFSSDGCSALVLFVLSRVGEKGYHSSDSFGARNFAGMDHNAQFHEGGIYRSAPSSDNVDIILSDRLCDPNTGLADTATGNFCFRKG